MVVREQLARHGLIDRLFQRFDEQLWVAGLMPKGGQIVDASLVSVPKNLAYNMRRLEFLLRPQSACCTV